MSESETVRLLRSVIPVLNQNKAARRLMGGFPRTIQLRLDGERDLHLIIAGEEIDLREGVAGSPDIVISGDSREFARVVKGDLDVSHPIARGKLRVERGKVSDMTLLTRILWSTKREGAT